MTQEADAMCHVWQMAAFTYPTYGKGDEDIYATREMYETNTQKMTKKSSHNKNKKNL